MLKGPFQYLVEGGEYLCMLQWLVPECSSDYTLIFPETEFWAQNLSTCLRQAVLGYTVRHVKKFVHPWNIHILLFFLLKTVNKPLSHVK